MNDARPGNSSRRAVRIGLMVGIPLALLLGARGASWAFDAVTGWTAGETLTAADMNALLERVKSLEAGPYGAEYAVTVEDMATDLGVQLDALLATHRNVRVTLKAGTEAVPNLYAWNTRVELKPYTRLSVVGEGYANFAMNLGVKVTMNSLVVFTEGGTDYRAPARLVAPDHSSFQLAGVVLEATGGLSALPLTRVCEHAGLFTVGEGATVDLFQSRITAAENIVNTIGRTHGNVRFGHTWIDRYGSLRDINPVSDYTGYGFGGGSAVVLPTTQNVTLGAGVSWLSSSRLTYY